MNPLLDWPPLPIPISAQLRQQADAGTGQSELGQSELGQSQTAKDRYQRSLATLVVQYYLRLIAVPHRLDSLPSGLMLHVEELGGYLACCAVAPGADTCKIPAIDRNSGSISSLQTRKGYLFIALSPPYHTAQLLGFTPTATVSELPLSYLQPLSAFTEALESPSVAPPLPRISAPDR